MYNSLNHYRFVFIIYVTRFAKGLIRTRTNLIHRFHRHSIATYINKQTVCICRCQQLISLLLLWLLSACQTSTGARIVFNYWADYKLIMPRGLALLVVNEKPLGCNSPHNCLVMLSIDLVTFWWYLDHKWAHLEG